MCGVVQGAKRVFEGRRAMRQHSERLKVNQHRADPGRASGYAVMGRDTPKLLFDFHPQLHQ